MFRAPLIALVPVLAAIAGLPGLAAAAPPEPARVRPDLISDPQWAQKPNGYDVSRHYPERAMQGNVSGRAILQCSVRRNGTMSGCVVMAESPNGLDFGAASLKLSGKFVLKRPADSEPSLEGRLVRIPMVWRIADGTPVPPATYQVGGGAVLVNVLAPGDNARGSIDCATTAEPARRCGLHSFDWVDHPTLDESAPVILATGQAEGLSQLSCLVGADGALTDCKPAGQMSDAARDAMLNFAPLLKAPPATEDGALMSSGRVIIAFDWANLSKAARVASRKN